VVRWAPFTADDIVFWYKDVLLNSDLTPSVPSWIRNTDGTAAKLEKIDDYAVQFTYDRPATLFLSEIANQDGPDGSFAMFLPAHTGRNSTRRTRRRKRSIVWRRLPASTAGMASFWRARHRHKTLSARQWRRGCR
jgi:ABC-type transport system substrate-binding protein